MRASRGRRRRAPAWCRCRSPAGRGPRICSAATACCAGAMTMRPGPLRSTTAGAPAGAIMATAHSLRLSRRSRPRVGLLDADRGRGTGDGRLIPAVLRQLQGDGDRLGIAAEWTGNHAVNVIDAKAAVWSQPNLPLVYPIFIHHDPPALKIIFRPVATGRGGHYTPGF